MIWCRGKSLGMELWLEEDSVAAAPTASWQECRQAHPPALPGLWPGGAASWFRSLPQLKVCEEITEDLCGLCLKTFSSI